MPYGIHSESETFQLEILKAVDGIEGVANSQDDIIVWQDKEGPLCQSRTSDCMHSRKWSEAEKI